MATLTPALTRCALVAGLLLGVAGDLSAERTQSGLVALYDFGSAKGDLVRDVSGAGEPVDLKIADPNAVRWSEGSLEVVGKTMIRSARSATRISDAVRLSGRLTVEAWVRPATLDQDGPARIVTLSPNSSQRNVTLGQDGARIEVRTRTTGVSDNGLPSVSTPDGTLSSELTHIVYTRSRHGRTRIYINGKLSSEESVPGTTVNWDGSYRLALASESSGDRPWLGTFHLVAVYNRDLLPEEVERHFAAGPKAASGTWGARTASREAENERLFTAEIAPIISRHCLECHDSAIREGKLDLSRRHAAFEGSSGGKVIEPGSAADSVLYTIVESDEMPEDRSPLPDRDKALLKEWIEGGALWPGEVIDPAAHRLSRSTGQTWLRRLTVPEYIETVRAALGVDVAYEAQGILPRDVRADGFRNTAYSLGVDLSHIEAYAKLAEIVVYKLDVHGFVGRFSDHQEMNVDNMRKIIAGMGRWMLRAPLAEHEVNDFLKVTSATTEYDEAVRYLVEAMLQSPRFMYQVETQRGDGLPWPVDDYELASRLSYTLWGAPPDRELMRAVDAGELYDRRQLGRQVERMLEDPRVAAKSMQFISDWLDLDRLGNLRPNPEMFPTWNRELAEDMRKETLAFFEDVVWKQERPLSDLLVAQITYATPRLAAFYDLPVSGGDGLKRYDVSNIPERGGLLTQGSLLTMGGDEASTVARGLFIMNDMLRGAVNNPPPGIDTRPEPAKPGLSKRAIAQKRIDNQSCGACHVRFETLAFGFEKYDGIGAYHERDEHGNALREDGEVLFPGEGEPVAYDTVAELTRLLAGHDRVRENLTRKVVQFAIGRPLNSADAPLVKEIHEAALAKGGTYRALLREIVLSDLVLTTPTEDSQ